MPSEAAQSPLRERYASPEMAHLFSARHRFEQWRRLWILLAECQHQLGLPIRRHQIERLRQVQGQIDLERVAELERECRHDVVAHLRHFAELAGEEAGGILHLGATSAFIADNTDLVLFRQALQLLEQRLVAVVEALAAFARPTRDLPTLGFTHLQPAQLTTVGKRACLWLQDFLTDMREVRYRLSDLRCRGVKGTTGTQASFLILFDGDHGKVRELDRMLAQQLGFAASFPLTGQTYPRKQDSQILATLAGIGESCHKFATDLRLLQGLGELSEPFDPTQVGSSAMAYKRNPIRAERICGLSRRLLTDALNGPLNAANQWLERSLDDSSNRRLVFPDAFLCGDAVLNLVAHLASGISVHRQVIAAHVQQEIPFMATETFLMQAVLRGGNRQELHERIRRYSLEAREAVARGEENPLVERIVDDPDFHLAREEVQSWLDPRNFTGRAAQQVDEFLDEVVRPALAGKEASPVMAPRV